MHLHCIDTPLSLIIDIPLNKNYVFDPKIVKELKHNIIKSPGEPEDMVKELYSKHQFESLFHICNTCEIKLGIQKIKNHTKHQVNFFIVFLFNLL